MSTQTIIEVVCDPCAARRKDVDGETVTVAGIEFDVCATHRKPLDAFEELAQKYGRKPSGRPAVAWRGKARSAVPNNQRTAQAARSGARVLCGLCSQDVAVGSRAWHAKHKHDLKASGIEWQQQ